ncbi:MAG TPA: aminotransferase class V-fold PLP-dependent enzyme [Candidatus Brocadiia bacterium]|nr:aminotransferase class V-fold PLP-dependent enzyme [Planctomycetota bacterium]MDO8093097.1 aminotransferase class V-fold PLP-dependent enzyme [Candidatus Brocadiales bacterium]
MIYLDNAATTYPKPECVYAKMDEFFRKCGANPGRAAYKTAVDSGREMEQTRHILAKFFGVKDINRIIFTFNATDALNIGIKGLLRQGDHVITTYLEHNSVSRPLQGLEEKGVISVARIERQNGSSIDADAIKKAITPKTKLVVLTHVSNVLGTIQPIEEIGRLVREKDLIFMVDAAQSSGVCHIDVEKQCIDLLAFTGHKGLFGPPGTGGLFVGERVNLAPFREGGTGVDPESFSQPEAFPHRLEGGTPNFVGIVGLRAGVEFVLNEGIGKIRKHEERLAKKIVEALEGDERFSLYGIISPYPPLAKGGAEGGIEKVGIVSLNVRNLSPSEVGAMLDSSFNIAVRTGLHCAPLAHKNIGTFPDGTVRISPGYFNTDDEIEEAITALKKIAGT